ncbi:MAG: DUF2341 domain-containing protein [Candidatus Paceibacterota bacterium]
MTHIKIHKKFVSVILLLLGLCAGLFAYGSVAKTEFVSETLKVIPDSITSTTWSNIEHIYEQDVSEYALYQEFSKKNSAFLYTTVEQKEEVKQEKNVLKQKEKTPQTVSGIDVTNDNNNSTTSEKSTSTIDTEMDHDSGESLESVDLEETTEVDEDNAFNNDLNEDVSNPDPDTEKLETELEPEQEPEQVSEESDKDIVDSEVSFIQNNSLVWGVFVDAKHRYPLLQELVTEEVENSQSDEETEPTEESEIKPKSEPSESLVTEEKKDTLSESEEESKSDNEVLINENGIDDEEIDEQEFLNAASTSPIVVTKEDVATNTTSNVASSSEADINVEEKPNKDIKNQKTKQVDSEGVAGSEQITTAEILMSGFGVPLTSDQIKISGAQLRLSLGAKVNKKKSDVKINLRLLYKVDAQSDWLNGGILELDEEISNSINGGYYLFALPEVVDEQTLSNLDIKLVYSYSTSDDINFYIDSSWLEVFTIERINMAETDLVTNFDNGFDNELLSGDILRLPNGEKISIKNTDDNTDETLIIKSDKTNYAGLSETATYFSVTNTSDKDDEFTLLTHFPNDVGEVKEINIWNQNKPKEVVVPEYGPFVYHCTDGWEYSGEPISKSLFDISKMFSPDKKDIIKTNDQIKVDNLEEVQENVSKTQDEEQDSSTDTEQVDSVETADSESNQEQNVVIEEQTEAGVDQSAGRSTTSDEVVDADILEPVEVVEENLLPLEENNETDEFNNQSIEDDTTAPIDEDTSLFEDDTSDSDTNTTSTVSWLPVLKTKSLLLNDVLVKDLVKTTSTKVVSDEIEDMKVDSMIDIESIKDDEDDTDQLSNKDEEEVVPTYMCRNTNIIRTCDSIEGDNTVCRTENVKVRENVLTRYESGWEKKEFKEGGMSKPGLLKRVGDFLGFGPELKDVPEEFSQKTHSKESYKIKSGETIYFKMDIEFPPFSSGEFWIEAIGDNEYGLLDPFWSSQWQYRMPITIDNTGGDETLTEYQVFLEVTSSESDFWTNVKSDGGDIRFVQETAIGREGEWYGTGWLNRIPVTIQSSQVTSDLTNFPVYVDLSDLGSFFFNSVQTDGSDIRITESDGLTELPYELVAIDTGGDTGELHFKASNISSLQDTTFYVYFGNPNVNGYSETDTYGSENVWTNNFLATYHLEENSAGTGNSGLYKDSTSNDEDADDEINSTGKTGKLGKGQEIRSRETNPDDHILIPNTVLNGETDVTTSFWLNTSQTGDQALLSGGASNDILIFLRNTSLVFYAGGSTATFALDTTVTDGNWHHFAVVRDDSSNQVRLYVDGQADNQNPISTSMSSLSIPVDCLMVGGEQDGCMVAWGQPQEIDGYVDEYRFNDAVLSADWISALYNNQSTTTDFYSIGSSESYISTTFTELDHWVQHFDYSGNEADIWVQVDNLPANSSSTIYLYYGNSSADSVSDEMATFSYSTTTDLYYVVDGTSTGDIEVYSLVDGNEISLDGGTPVSLDAGETTGLSGYSSSSVISTLGPISATINDAKADSVTPISFATTTHAVPTNRNTSSYFIHSPYGTASVQTYIGSSGTADESFTVATGSTKISNTDAGGTNGVIIESDLPILVYHQESSRDSIVAYPPTTRDLFGIDSNSIYVTSLTDNPDPSYYCSGGNSGTLTGVTRGEAQGFNNCSQGADGTGDAVRLTGASYPMSAIQQADGDGSESTMFWPQHEFSTEYYLTTDTAYVAVVCSPRFGSSNIEVQTNGGSTVESATCSPSGNLPGKAYFDNSQGGDALAFTAGHKVVSTNRVPFYVMYEDDVEDNDETNILSAVQARKYNGVDKPYTFGSEEINIDAEYEQLSFAWYENIDAQTPTTPWSLGEGVDADEGDSITGQGAVNTNAVLRLRMNLLANSATGSAESSAFELQYAKANTCSTANNWQPIGEVGSSTAAFSGYNNSVDDGTTLSSRLLASSTVSATYEEASLSEFLPNEIGVDEVAEWDWVLTNSNADTNSNYCFRMIRSTGEALTSYTLYPQLETSGPPEPPTLSKFFDNERTASATPVLEFTTTDVSGDSLRYQVQLDNDYDFSSVVFDRNSETHFTQFENLNTPSDKSPFDSGALIRFTGQSAVSASTTYWWRVRAKDPDGSNMWSDWSEPFSFTTWGTTTVSEWYQTTDEQFETNSLVGLSTTGSDSVELNIGKTVIGEYGTVSLSNGATTTVNLDETYSNPVVVASIRYARSVPNGDQPSARVFNKTATSFDVLTDNYTGDAPGSATVDYMVMEAGEYIIDDGGGGTRVYASSTSVSSYIGSPISGDPGTDITFPTSFSGTPVVLTMVTTNNDPDWVLSAVYDGNNVTNPPTATGMGIYLHDNIASDGHSSAEDIDFIVFDKENGMNNAVAFDILNSGISSGVVDDVPDTISFSSAFSSAPGLTLVQILTMNGNQGGYAMVDTDTPATASGVTVAVEEGGTSGGRTHADEDVGIVAFQNATGTIIRAGSGQMTSTAIDFDDGVTGNAWGEIRFSDTGDVVYHVEYNTGSGFSDIPDSALPGNSSGFTTSPINILDLDTETYNEIRLVANLSGANPEVYEWTVVWGQRVDIPTHFDPFDNEKISTTTPTLEFTSSDPQSDDLVYEVSWSTDNTFASASTTINSSSSVNFNNISSSTDTSPFVSGDRISYKIQSGEALTNGQTYWWRVRAKDPAGSNSFSPWSGAQSFTVDTSVTVSTWFQTTAEQFRTGTLIGVSASTTGGFVSNDSTVGEYATAVITNGSSTVIQTQRSYNNPVVVASVRYDIPTDTQRVARVTDKQSDQFTVLVDNYNGSVSGKTTIDYMVIEEGDWTIEDGSSGTRVLAATHENVSTVRANDVGDGLSGESITFSPSFSTAPAVITTVSSNNDTSWVFSSVHSPSDVTLPPTTDGFILWLNRSFESATHGAEDVDYIAFETGHGTNTTNEFDAVVSGDSVSNTPTSVSFSSSFSSAPQVTHWFNKLLKMVETELMRLEPVVHRLLPEDTLSLLTKMVVEQIGDIPMNTQLILRLKIHLIK